MLLSRSLLSVILFVTAGLCAPCPLGAQIIPADRRVDWRPGLPGGIPLRTTVFGDVRSPPYNAAGDGLQDDTAAIQRALDDCPEGQVVHLPEGVYRITSALQIAKGIVLRGDGRDKSQIRIDSTGANAGILVGGFGSNSLTRLSTDAFKGDTSITVTDASDFSVGDYIVIDQLNDYELVDNNTCRWCSRDNGARAKGQLGRIEQKNGNTLVIAPELYSDYTTTLSAEISMVSRGDQVVEFAGIENLKIERMALGGHDNIQFKSCALSWIRNIESYNSYERHISFRNTLWCEVRDSYIHHGLDYQGGHAYGVSLGRFSTATLVENNIFYHLRHSMEQESGGGNVFGYNYSLDPYGWVTNPDNKHLYIDISTHGAHPHMNLWEGNIAARVGFDYVHGSSSHQTVFRNHITRESNTPFTQPIRQGLRAIEVQEKSTYVTIVGNVIGKPSQSWTYFEADLTREPLDAMVYAWGFPSEGARTSTDPQSKATAFRHGNYDYFNEATLWEPTEPGRTLPPSLYLTNKPAFFGSRPWPAIGPDVSPMVGSLPAKERFERILSGDPIDNLRPSPPQNLKVVERN